MPRQSTEFTRRSILAAAGAGAASLFATPPVMAAEEAPGGSAIRPFSIKISEDVLDDLRRPLSMTRWPDKETVADQSQGAPLARLQTLVRYSATDYDWRKCEARLNAFPQFITTIDGLDIHFIHVRSR